MFIMTDATVDVGHHVLIIGIGSVYPKIREFIDGNFFLNIFRPKCRFESIDDNTVDDLYTSPFYKHHIGHFNDKECRLLRDTQP